MAPCTKCNDMGPPPGNKFCDQCGKGCMLCGGIGPPPTSDESVCMSCGAPRREVDRKQVAAASLKKAIGSFKVLDIENCLAAAKKMEVTENLIIDQHGENLYETATETVKKLHDSMTSVAETLAKTQSSLFDKDLFKQALERIGDITPESFQRMGQELEKAVVDSKEKAINDVVTKGYTRARAEAALNACNYDTQAALNELEEEGTCRPQPPPKPRVHRGTLPTNKVWLFAVQPHPKQAVTEGEFPQVLKPFAFKSMYDIKPERASLGEVPLTLEINFSGSRSEFRPLKKVTMNLSFPSVITLPPRTRSELGISKRATYFCCVYPAKDALTMYPLLEQKIPRAEEILTSGSPATSKDAGEAADLCFLTIGGFLYFSKSSDDGAWIIENMKAIVQSPNGQLRFDQIAEKPISAFGEPRYDDALDRLVVGKHIFHKVTKPALKSHGVTHYTWIRCNDLLGTFETFEEWDAVCGHGGFAYINYEPRPPTPPVPATILAPPETILLPASTTVAPAVPTATAMPTPFDVCQQCPAQFRFQPGQRFCGNCCARRPENPMPAHVTPFGLDPELLGP